MTRRLLPTKLEEVRQACHIHGGVMRMCVAALGVKLARVKIPSRRLRLLVFRTVYGQKFHALDETECDRPLWAYPSLDALFTRGVRPELRPIPDAGNQFVCPCDGRVQDVGRIEHDRLITVKGVEYTVGSLLPGVDTTAFHGGQFGIIFLSPNDCHRVFSSQDGTIEEVLHVPGYRLLVHPPYQRKEFPVFSLNERVIIRLSTPLGACVQVMVAGWGVGHIRLAFDPSFRPHPRRLTRQTYATPVAVKIGQWLATFGLGSTVIVITAPAEGTRTHVVQDEKVKYGQPLFSVAR